MSVVLSEHLSLLATAPDGIQKLRGLILELAVRGKLVPQDPNDEPARELLKRITNERGRLEAEGVLKKSKPTPPVKEDEQPFALPVGWAWIRFTHLGDFRGGKTPSTNRSEYWEGSIPWVSPKDMKSLVVSQTEDYVTELAISDGLTIIPASSVLIVVRSGILRRTVPVAINSLRCTLNQDLKALCLVLPDMARYAQLLIRGFERLILNTLTKVGTTVESIKFEEFSQQPFPLPPLAEQHRIVAKVDELMALCDRLEAEQTGAEAAHAKLVETLLGALTQSADAADLAANWQRLADHFDTLFTTEPSLNALKQTILQLAVMGKLVPQDPNDEPASELLKRIAKERARMEAEGVCKKFKATPLVSEGEQPYPIPSNWAWVRFGAIAVTRLGKMLDAAKNSGVLKPYLRNTNVQWFRFELDDVKELRLEPEELDEFRLENGDLLICEGGEPGRCAIWRSATAEMYFQKALHRARPNGGVLAEYLQLVLRQDAVSGALDTYFTGATIKHFPGDKLTAYTVPLPPVNEQHRIVAKVDELMALCDRLKADLAESRARQARLSATLIESALAAA